MSLAQTITLLARPHLASAIADDRSAQERLCRAIEPALCKEAGRLLDAFRFGRGDASGSDIVQDVLTAVWQGIARFEDRGGVCFGGWVLQILKNTILDRHRRRRAQRRQGRRVGMAAETMGACLDNARRPPTTPPEALLRDDRLAVVERALPLLRDDDRQMIELFRNSGGMRDYGAWAHALGLQRGTVQKRFVRATVRLLQVLRSQGQSTDDAVGSW